MDANPFQAPMAGQLLASPKGPEPYVIENSLLVVRSGEVLPCYCVKTGEPVSPEQMERRILHWCHFFAFLMMFLAPFIGFVVYAILRQKCLITFGMSKTAKRPYWIRVGIASFLMAAAAAGVVIGAKLKMGSILLGSVVLVPVAIIVMLFGNTPFAAVRHENGEFWLKGSSPEFLARLERRWQG
jgi:hypothetical protein